jgi:hypothetical protein
MPWRRVRALTLVLLGLLLAAPLSSGDKGLWLSLAATPVHLLEASAGHPPAEHSTLVPDTLGRAVAAARTDRADPVRSLGATSAPVDVAAGERWTAAATAPVRVRGELIAARPEPRAPPA